MSYSNELIPSFINPDALVEPFTLDKYDNLQLSNIKKRLEVFSEIQTRLSGRQRHRIQEIKDRLENIKNRLHNLKIVITQTSAKILSSDQPFPINEELSETKWCQPENSVSLIELFSPESSHNNRVLEECEPELDFAQFDKFRKDGVKSKSLYSNPEFFLQEYMSTAEITKKKKTSKKVVRKIAEPVHTKPIPKRKKTEDHSKPAMPVKKDSIPIPPSMDSRSSIPPPPPGRPHTMDSRSSIPPPPSGLPPGMSPPVIESRSSIPPPPPPGLPPGMSPPATVTHIPDQPKGRKSSASAHMPDLPPSSLDNLTSERSAEHEIPTPPEVPTEKFTASTYTEPSPAPDMPSLDKDDEEGKQEREGAINNLLQEIQKQKTKSKKVKTVLAEEREYENPLEAAIRNVNRSKLKKVKTRDESKIENAGSDFTTSQSKGLFDVLALRTAMHEESEEEVVVDDEDWT